MNAGLIAEIVREAQAMVRFGGMSQATLRALFPRIGACPAGAVDALERQVGDERCPLPNYRER